jgi:hypothetical protein
MSAGKLPVLLIGMATGSALAALRQVAGKLQDLVSLGGMGNCVFSGTGCGFLQDPAAWCCVLGRQRSTLQ